MITIYKHTDLKKLKIFHGPVNIGGIGRYLADWQRKQGAISDFIVWNDNPNRNDAHFCLNIYKYPGKIKKIIKIFINFFLCLFKYDIFHFYFAKSLLPYNLDLPILKIFRKKMIMTYCGSDIRLVKIEKKYNVYYKFLMVGMDHPRYDKKKMRIMRWQNLWIDCFTAIRNIYSSARKIIPHKKIRNDFWINNVPLDFSKDIPCYKPNETPVIVHAPTSPEIKGSAFVEKAIQKLKEQGVAFKYIRLEKVPYQEANRIYHDQADIFVDQFFLGDFGNFACEGMYYGRPVCCYLIGDVLKWYPDCPIVNCTIENLHEKLAWLIKNPDKRVEIGKRGQEFVKNHCDPEKINQRVWDLYKELAQKSKDTKENKTASL